MASFENKNGVLTPISTNVKFRNMSQEEFVTQEELENSLEDKAEKTALNDVYKYFSQKKNIAFFANSTIFADGTPVSYITTDDSIIAKRARSELIELNTKFDNTYSIAEGYKCRALYYTKNIVEAQYFAKLDDWVFSTDGVCHLDSSYENVAFVFSKEDSSLYISADEVKEAFSYDFYFKMDSNQLAGKTVAIIGDSISTDKCTKPNVSEIIINEGDVGKELSAYLTYWDVDQGLSLGGHTFTSDEIGTEVTFTPVASDIGKTIGRPNFYLSCPNANWWILASEILGFTPIPVCWSGGSITSHEASDSQYACSYAWHESQIRKCGVRAEGSMQRTAPDYIIIYRGVNDFSHNPYTRLTDDYFSNSAWDYPVTDEISAGVFGFKEGLCLTIKKLREAYPNAKIILCTLNVFKRVNYAHFPTNNGINTLPQYNNAIREVADFMGCGLIEFDKDGITFENCYSEGYIVDSPTTPTHPSQKGHEVMAIKAIKDLKKQFG